MRALQPRRLSLLLTAAFVGAGILSLSYSDMSGMLSHDSMHYLRLAENLVEGKGYQFSPSPGGEGAKFVATWPVGYPTLVAGISLLTGWGVFFASKAVNIAAALAVVAILFLADRRAALFAAPLLLTAPLLTGYSMSLSEGVFIAGMVLLCLCIWRYWMTGSSGWLAATAAAGLGLFLTRYLGIVSVAVMGAATAGLILKKRRREAAGLVLAGALVAFLCAAYLFHNRMETGHATGIKRTHYHQFSGKVVGIAASSHFNQLSKLVTLREGNGMARRVAYHGGRIWSVIVLVLLLAAAIRGSRREDGQGRDNGFALTLLVTGFLYLAAVLTVLSLGRVPAADIENGRLLLPATTLLLLALLLFTFGVAKRRLLAAVWISIPAASFLLNAVAVPLYSVKIAGLPTWPAYREQVVQESGEAVAGDALITRNTYNFLLRPDLHVRIYYPFEDLGEVVREMCGTGRKLYLDRGLASKIVTEESDSTLSADDSPETKTSIFEFTGCSS